MRIRLFLIFYLVWYLSEALCRVICAGAGLYNHRLQADWGKAANKEKKEGILIKNDRVSLQTAVIMQVCKVWTSADVFHVVCWDAI